MATPQEYQPGAKYALVKSDFNNELAKYNYQQIIQHLSSLTVTRDNVNEDLTKDGREVLKLLTEKKDELSKEPLQWHRDIMENYKDLKVPLEEQINRVLGEKKAVATKINEEIAQQVAEQNRIMAAKSAIPEFTNKIANMIQLAKTDDDVVAIEKLIGSEKTKKSVYQEFLPDLIEQCDGLRPQIKALKETIRELKLVEEQEKAALQDNDATQAVKMREKREYLEAVVQETGIRIHETAYEQATTIDIIAPEVIDTAPKGRTNWKWRVDDIKKLQKKMPHLVKLVPDEEAINTLLKTKRADGSLEGKMEENVFGLVFYNDKTYSK